MVRSSSTSASTDVPGFRIVHEFVSEEEEGKLGQAIRASRLVIGTPRIGGIRKSGDGRDWIARYGPAVRASGYREGDVVSVAIPFYLERLCARLVQCEVFAERPNAISVNEYLVGQGLALHSDNDCTGPVIASLGILGEATMVIQRASDPRFEIALPRRALAILEPPCRYHPWRHAIDPVRERRVSIVFRYVPAATRR